MPAFKTNWLVAWLTLLSTLFSNAHTLPISDLILVADEDYLHLELSLNPSELNLPSDFTTSNDRDAKEKVLALKILEHISVTVGAKCLAAETAGIVRSGESHHLELRAHYPLAAAASGILQIESRLCDLTGASHLTQVTFRQGDAMQLAQLNNQIPTADFKLARVSPPALSGNSVPRAESQPLPATTADATQSSGIRKWFTLVLLLVLLSASVLFSTLISAAQSAKYEDFFTVAIGGDDDRHQCFRR